MALLPFPMALHPRSPNPNANPRSISFLRCSMPAIFLDLRRCRSPSVSPSPSLAETLRRHSAMLLHLVASAVFLVGFSARASAIAPSPIYLPTVTVASEDRVVECCDSSAERAEDEALRAAFERWKSKTYALTVPLRIVALRSSIPVSWIKEFTQSQGRRLKLNVEFRGTLESIFSDLTSTSVKGCLEPKSAMAADMVSVGDSWLSYAIVRGLLEPIRDVEEQDWFKGLSEKWKEH